MTGSIDTQGLPPVVHAERSRFARSAAVDPIAAVPSTTRVDRVELSGDVMPPELGQEIEFAFERAAQLASQNRELHFAKDEESGRIVVQVRDLEGNVIKIIPNAKALDVMSGASL